MDDAEERSTPDREPPRLKINADGWAKIVGSLVVGATTTALGAATFREALVVVPVIYASIFVASGFHLTRIMPSDMLDGFVSDEARELHDRKARRLGIALGVILLPAIVLWAWFSTDSGY